MDILCSHGEGLRVVKNRQYAEIVQLTLLHISGACAASVRLQQAGDSSDLLLL